MKTDQIIAELFSLLRLLIEQRASASDVAARLAALESWRVEVERMRVTQPIEEL